MESRSSRGSLKPALYGLIWGAGVAVAICSYLLQRSTSAWSVLAIFFIFGPLIFLASLAAGAVIYTFAARRFPQLKSTEFLFVAVLFAILLAAIPYIAQAIELHSIARREIPAYPGSLRLDASIRGGGAARITVLMRTSGRKEDVLKYYDGELQKRNWMVYPDVSFNVSATKPGYTLFVYFQENTGEIRAEWYRNFANH